MSFRFNDRTYHVDADHIEYPYGAAKSQDSAWLFDFGVYTPPGVLVYGGYLSDALEVAADSGHAGGAMIDGEPNYAEAQADLGWDGDFGDLTLRQQEEVRQEAEADLTYTEAGWLTWEWHASEVAHGGDLYGDGVAVWVKENPDWVDDPEEEVRDVLAAAGASEDRIKAALKALRNHYGE